MAFIGPVSANVEIEGNILTAIPVLSSSQTSVSVIIAEAGSTANIYSVPAGKTLYIYGFCVQQSTVQGAYKLSIQGGSDIVNMQVKGVNQHNGYMGGGCPIAVATTGQQINYTAAGTSTAQMWGVLV